MAEKRDRSSRFPVVAIVLLLGLFAGIFLSSWKYYQSQKAHLIAAVADELSAIEILKAGQLTGWINHRNAEADLIAESRLFIDGTPHSFQSPLHYAHVLAILSRLKNDFKYSSIFIADASGKIIINPDSASHKAAYIDTAIVRKTVVCGKPEVVDLYRCPFCGKIHFDDIAPLGVPEKDHHAPDMVIVFRSDPEDFLFPLIKSWPVPSKTAETVLFRRDGDSLVYLNELRHKKGTALDLKYPLNSALLPAARCLRGEEGFVAGTDYRGQQVFAVARRVAGTPWFMVAKVDRDEALAPLRTTASALIVIAILVAAVVLFFLVLWRVLLGRRILIARYDEEVKRGQVQQELLKSEEKFRIIFEFSSIGISMTTPDGRVHVNKTFCEMLGYVQEELENKTWQEITHPDDIDLTQGFLEKIISRKEESARFIKRYIKKNGEAVWTDASTILHRNKTGNPQFYITSVMDITGRMQAEIALSESERLYRSLFENMLNGFAYCRMLYDNECPVDFIYLSVNSAFERLTGLRNVAGKKVSEVIPGIRETDPVLFEMYGRVASTGKPEQFEIEVKSLTMWFSISVYCPKPEHFVAVFDVITARKHAENKIAALNRDLFRKNTELEQLVYVASHDLRSPLVNIQGFAKELGISIKSLEELIGKVVFPGREREKIDLILHGEIPESQEYILASVTKMDQLLAGLLKLSRLGRAAFAVERLDMNQAVGFVAKTFEYRIKETGIEMAVENLPFCMGDKVQINQAVSNLLDNAIKFLSPERKGFIKISGKINGDAAVYCIEDNGIGMEKEFCDKIFELFYRLNTKASEGEGLGLTIVRRSLDRQLGRVWAESEPGKGSKFYMQLPAAKQD